MLHTLQKKPIETRKKIVTLGVILGVIGILPLLILGWREYFSQKTQIQEPNKNSLMPAVQGAQVELRNRLNEIKASFEALEELLEEGATEGAGVDMEEQGASGGAVLPISNIR